MTIDKLYIERANGQWEGWHDTEEGKYRRTFYELTDAYRWASQHGYTVVEVTY